MVSFNKFDQPNLPFCELYSKNLIQQAKKNDSGPTSLTRTHPSTSSQFNNIISLGNLGENTRKKEQNPGHFAADNKWPPPIPPRLLLVRADNCVYRSAASPSRPLKKTRRTGGGARERAGKRRRRWRQRKKKGRKRRCASRRSQKAKSVEYTSRGESRNIEIRCISYLARERRGREQLFQSPYNAEELVAAAAARERTSQPCAHAARDDSELRLWGRLYGKRLRFPVKALYSAPWLLSPSGPETSIALSLSQCVRCTVQRDVYNILGGPEEFLWLRRLAWSSDENFRGICPSRLLT